MNALRIALCAAAISLASFAIYAQPAPVTATCKDGTDWSGKTRSGACSHHGGVKAFGVAAVRPELTKRPDLTVKGTNPEPVGLSLQAGRVF